MRMLFSGLVAAGLLTSQTAGAACVPTGQRDALDLVGLKTQLMVITLTCHLDSQYNAFINKFKPDLVAEERTAKSYFSHNYGRSSQKRQDEYMTQLANAKSDAGLRQGNRFCAHNEGVFSEVLALRNAIELKQYAAGRATATPVTLTTCGETAERPTRASTRQTSRGRRG